MRTDARAGRTDSLVDVAGIRVGHATRNSAAYQPAATTPFSAAGAPHSNPSGVGCPSGHWLTGATVVLTGPEGAVCGVDVRGGGPGTRETDLLDPRNLIERVHAVVLSGGSAFGLAVADGVLARLERDRIGFPVGRGVDGRPMVVPIVPAAVIFDLGRGGDPRARPDSAFGSQAYDAALAWPPGTPPQQGNVGAGTGAVAGVLKGGVGTASQVLDDGSTVAALVVANPVGSVLDPATGELWGARHLFAGEERPGPGSASELIAHLARVGAGQPIATTLVVVATDATLTKARCAKVAGIAQDGLARAISPVHTMFDGDTAFALATCARPEPGPEQLHALLAAAADCTTRAVVHAVLAAESVTTPAGSWPSYRDAFPSAFT